MNQPIEQWTGVPIPLNVRPDSGVRVIATTQLAPASVPGLDGPSDPSVVATRVTFFPGRTAPWVEVWVRRPSECGELDTPSAYTYYDLHRPPCDTQEEWLVLLATGQTTVLTPPTETPAYRCDLETDITRVPDPIDPEHPSTRRAQLVECARLIHDAKCLCDSRYLMSCPHMAQAILDCGRP